MRTERFPRLAATLLLAALVPAPATAQGAGTAEIVVSVDGSVRTIADGVRLARPGGTVVVLAGTYREPMVRVEKPLTIEGRGWPTLDGEDERALLLVTADDVTIRGIRFARVGISMTEDRAAVRVSDARRCAIVGNRFHDAFFGVYLARVEGCRIEGNEFVGRGGRESESTNGNAVHLWSVRDVDIVRNRIAGHRDGIYFEFVRQGRVAENVSEENIRYGLHFMYSDSSRYERNIFRRNGAGVAVMYTNVVEMTGNHFVDNRGSAAYGLLLKEIADPVLRANVFARNTVGMMADGTTRLVAEDNVFADNGWGVRLLANVQESRLIRNDFRGNSFDLATNGRAGDGAGLAGNWFEEYRGYDLDRDGRGDVPHRPVRLFSLLVERWDAVLVLQRSFFVGLLDGAERLLPSLTPERLVDAEPSMRPVAAAAPEAARDAVRGAPAPGALPRGGMR
ncbi:MAG TPA: nitrous oxide reductase family maturation protein NosD [Gemmatimonadaceae bacterium]